MSELPIEIVRDAENMDSDSENQESDNKTPAPAPEPDIDWGSLKVKNLTKAQRSKLIQDSEAGIENNYFKVQQMRNGTTRIVRRSNPLTASASTESKINERYTGKRLTTEQLLMEHVLELERKYEIMRQKHKRLKKRYNKLETDIFDSDDEPIAAEDISKAVEPEPAATSVVDFAGALQENPVKVKEPETLPQEPIITAAFRPRNGKPSWRSMITIM